MTERRKTVIFWIVLIGTFVILFFVFRDIPIEETKPRSTGKTEASKKLIKELTRINLDLDNQIRLLQESSVRIELRRCKKELRSRQRTVQKKEGDDDEEE